MQCKCIHCVRLGGEWSRLLFGSRRFDSVIRGFAINGGGGLRSRQGGLIYLGGFSVDAMYWHETCLLQGVAEFRNLP